MNIFLDHNTSWKRNDRNDRSETRDNLPVLLEPTLYHDVPTNTTTSSSLDAPQSNLAESVVPSPSQSVQISTSSLSQLMSTYFMNFVKSIFRFVHTVTNISISTTKELMEHSHDHDCEPSKNIRQKDVDRLGVTIVCISDTHGEHDKLSMPKEADMLICAGDYTKFGKKEQLISFNEWLGKLPYQTKVVVNGNHECNAVWKHSAKTLLSNAILLVDEFIEVEFRARECDQNDKCKEDGSNDSNSTSHNEIFSGNQSSNDEIDNNLNTICNTHKKAKKEKLKIYGTNFYWPCNQETNPYFEQIDSSIDILISHCPADGYVDNNRGCPALLNAINNQIHPKIVVSGHEHSARGVQHDQKSGVTFVNAANASNGHTAGKQPIVLRL